MTSLQKKFIDILDEFGYDIFNINMIKNTNKLSDTHINQVIRTLTKSGLLIRLERGKYIRSNFSDSFVIGNFLANDGGIAYWSALSYHNLTEQFVNVVFVQTSKRKSEELSVNNSRYKLIQVNSRKLFGYQEIGFGNHKYKITDIEKTIVDCFDLPHLAGWYPEIIKAFYKAKINEKKLIKYCKKNNNTSVTKRLGYLSDYLKKTNMESFILYAKSSLQDSYSLFEIDGEPTGKYNKRWKLIINMSEDEIWEIAKS